jgi:hypothetical protein
VPVILAQRQAFYGAFAGGSLPAFSPKKTRQGGYAAILSSSSVGRKMTMALGNGALFFDSPNFNRPLMAMTSPLTA